jgi:hypothetical protein
MRGRAILDIIRPYQRSSKLTAREAYLAADVVLLGLSYPNEQDEAFAAFDRYQPLELAQMRDVERRAAVAIEGKGPCWWKPR